MNNLAKDSSATIPIITAKAFCTSLEKALANPPDIDLSIRRIQRILTGLPDKLKRDNQLSGHLYSFVRERVHWNVPPELEWMNASGSIWKTFYPPNGTITIYNDFIIMLADGELLIWEHEGLMKDFRYRCQASERASVIKYTGTVCKDNLIETYEHDIDTPEKLIDIIERCILPRLWF